MKTQLQLTSHIFNTALSTCNLTLILLTSLCDPMERIRIRKRTRILQPKLNSTTPLEAKGQLSVFFSV